MRPSRGIPRLCRHLHRRQRGHFTTPTRHHHRKCLPIFHGIRLLPRLQLRLVLQPRHRQHLPAGHPCCPGPCLHLLLPRGQGQEVAHVQEVDGDQGSTRGTPSPAPPQLYQCATAVVKWHDLAPPCNFIFQGQKWKMRLEFISISFLFFSVHIHLYLHSKYLIVT